MGGCCFVCIYVCEGVGKRGGGKRVERTIINRICAILWLSIWSIHKQLLFSLSLVLYAQMLRNGLFLSFKPARCLSKKKKKNSHKSKKDVGEGGTYEKKKSKKKAKIVSPSLSLEQASAFDPFLRYFCCRRARLSFCDSQRCARLALHRGGGDVMQHL